MTEQQWQTSDRPTEMLTYLRDWASPRKLRLFGVACCYRIWQYMSSAVSRNTLEIAERFADGLVSAEDLRRAHEAARAEALRIDAAVDGADAAMDVALADAADAAVFSSGHVVNAVYERMFMDKQVQPGTRADYQELAVHAHLLRVIFGNPFRPVTIALAWRTPTVLSQAEAINAEKAFERLPMLADALVHVGCADAHVLNHCGGPGPHVRGCWVIDALLGKE
jgi:hypothetical protein